LRPFAVGQVECHEPRDRRRRKDLPDALTNAGLHVIQLIKRLPVVSILRCDPNSRVTRDQTIYKIGRNPPLVTVFENESSVGAAAGHIRIELEFNVAASFSHLLTSCKFRRDQTELHGIAVNRERQIAKYRRRVRALLRLSNALIRIIIDVYKYCPKDARARR